MAEYIGSAVGGANAVTKEYPVANSVTVTDGDFVYLTGGRVTNASIAGKTLLGMVVGKASNALDNHTTTLTATGDTNGTVKVLVIVEPNAKYVVTNDNDTTTFAASHVGTCFDLIGNTGAQLVDTSTTSTTGSLQCIQFGYGGDNTKGVFIINEHKYKVNA
jgi:hypothetical protein